LRGITIAGDALVIGAMTRHAEVERSPPVKQAIPARGCPHATKDGERQPMLSRRILQFRCAAVAGRCNKAVT
jgi:hypothetical protein